MLCLGVGKHVLCEKAFTVNAAQARKLCEIAKAKKLFLMEAVWTRYFPLSIELRQMVKDGKIGVVHRILADLSLAMDVEGKFGTEHRMVNKDLAGGAILDLDRKPPNRIASVMSFYDKTGADDNTSILCVFPQPNGRPDIHGIATTTMRIAGSSTQDRLPRPAIRIQGTKGEISVMGPAYRPLTYRLIPAKGANWKYEETTNEIPDHGMHWEADECARCIQDGKLESDGLGWEESCVIMATMDECRKQNGHMYPEKIESTKYPLDGF